MYRQFYEAMPLSHLPLFTLLLFVGIFGAVLVRLFFKKSAQDFDLLARLPLEDSEHCSGESR